MNRILIYLLLLLFLFPGISMAWWFGDSDEESTQQNITEQQIQQNNHRAMVGEDLTTSSTPQSCPYTEAINNQINLLNRASKQIIYNPSNIDAMYNFELQKRYARRLIANAQITGLCNSEVTVLSNVLQNTAYAASYADEERARRADIIRGLGKLSSSD